MSDAKNNIPPIDGTRTVTATPPSQIYSGEELPEKGTENGTYITYNESGNANINFYKDGTWYSVGDTSASGLYIGQITDSFPTTRPDGTDLRVGDYGIPSTERELPYTVDVITFESRTDKVVYVGNGLWLLNASAYQNTKELPVKDKSKESIGYTANEKPTQYDINIENVESYLEGIHKYSSLRSYKAGKLVYYNGAIWESKTDYNKGNIPTSTSNYWSRITPYKYIHNQAEESDIWIVEHNLNTLNPLLQCVINNNLVSLLDVIYISSNKLEIHFTAAQKGIAVLF